MKIDPLKARAVVFLCYFLYTFPWIFPKIIVPLKKTCKYTHKILVTSSVMDGALGSIRLMKEGGLMPILMSFGTLGLMSNKSSTVAKREF